MGDKPSDTVAEWVKANADGGEYTTSTVYCGILTYTFTVLGVRWEAQTDADDHTHLFAIRPSTYHNNEADVFSKLFALARKGQQC